VVSACHCCGPSKMGSHFFPSRSTGEWQTGFEPRFIVKAGQHSNYYPTDITTTPLILALFLRQVKNKTGLLYLKNFFTALEIITK
jgi:hypothetical protein